MSKKLGIIYLVVRKRSGSGSMLRGHTLSTFIFYSLTITLCHINIKETVSRDGYFCWGSQCLNPYFVCRYALMVFKVCIGFLLYNYTNIYFLFTSIKFLTNFENLLKPSSEFFVSPRYSEIAPKFTCHRRLSVRFYG